MAVADHRWVQLVNPVSGVHARCIECGIFSEQADANCWRPVKTNRERLAEALENVLSDFFVDQDGTVYYKGRTDGSNVHDRRHG